MYRSYFVLLAFADFIIFYLNQLEEVRRLDVKTFTEIENLGDGRLVSANLNHGDIGAVNVAFMG